MNRRQESPDDQREDFQHADEERWEKCLLGGILTDHNGSDRAFAEAAEQLSAADLRTIPAKAVWQAMADLVEDGVPITDFTVNKRLNQNNASQYVGRDQTAVLLYLSEIQDGSLPVSSCVPQVLEASRRRRLRAAAQRLIEGSQDISRPADEAVREAEKILAGQEVSQIKIEGQHVAVQECQEDLDRRIQLQGQLSGIPTGFTDLDWRLQGLQFGEMTIIGARPSQGKTAIGINILEHACFGQNIPTLFVSLEMKKHSIIRRMAASVCDISLTSLRSGQLEPDDVTKLGNFFKAARRMPAWWIEAIGGGTNIQQLSRAIRRHCERHGVKLVIVDYLQKISAAGSYEKKTYEIGAVSTMLKGTAVKTNAAFLVLAQLNRDSTKDGEGYPKPSQLGDSKQIEQDADTIVLIHRKLEDEEYQPRLIIAKQRDGATGVVEVDWDGSRGRFKTHRVNQPG